MLNPGEWVGHSEIASVISVIKKSLTSFACPTTASTFADTGSNTDSNTTPDAEDMESGVQTKETRSGATEIGDRGWEKFTVNNLSCGRTALKGGKKRKVVC